MLMGVLMSLRVYTPWGGGGSPQILILILDPGLDPSRQVLPVPQPCRLPGQILILIVDPDLAQLGVEVESRQVPTLPG